MYHINHQTNNEYEQEQATTQMVAVNMMKKASSIIPIEKKTRYSKLERLLAQPDIFDVLRKIGNG